MSLHDALIGEFGEAAAARITALHNAYGLVTITRESLKDLQTRAERGSKSEAADKLLIACSVMWQEEWQARTFNLRRMIQIDREGLRLSSLSSKTKDYWGHLIAQHEHELALLQNIRDAMDAAEAESRA